MVSQICTYFNLFSFCKTLFYFLKKLLSIFVLGHRAPKGFRNGMFDDHKAHAIGTIPLFHVQFVTNGTFLIKRCRPFFLKCKVKIYATKDNQNIFFPIIEGCATKLRNGIDIGRYS